ncbi:MAG: helix-turn-helix transcriptional regulator [Gemmatimonadetes bacterium]|nr:helix-turn-helix transcriptional regulator [Gemmatimonadota bacterium]
MNISSDVGRREATSQPRPSSEVRSRGVSHVAPQGEDRCTVDVVHLQAIATARATLPDDLAVGRVVALLAMLSNSTRLKMLLALRPEDSETYPELCVCDLAVVAGASQSMTSHQLRLLRTAGLVVARRDGKVTFYRLRDAQTTALLADALRVMRWPLVAIDPSIALPAR